MAGKGSAPRPIPDKAKFEKNWDAIFKPKAKDDGKKTKDPSKTE